MNKLQKAIVSLLSSEPFYGHLISRMRIRSDNSVPTAGVYVTDKINLIYNKEWLETLEVFDIAKVLKHECAHILQEHITRAKQIGINNQDEHKKFNIATDVTINVGDLIPTVEKIGGITVSKLNETLKSLIDKFNETNENKKTFKPMLEGQLSEYYYNRLNEFIDENPELMPKDGVGDSMDDHSVWDKSEGSEELIKAVSKNTINEAVKAAGGIGSLPSDIASMVSSLNKSQVNWKQQLRQFFVNTMKSSKIQTRKRRNRRYGILQPGVKKKPEVHLGLCVDTSGSVSNSELSMFWSEIKAIHSCGVKITIIEADCVVQNVYEFEPKDTPEFKGRGGTAYNPAINKAVELDVDGIIYCGDFDSSDTPKDPKKPFLWVGVRNSPPPASFGRVIYLTDI